MKRQRGFTLLELIVVMALIGLMSAIALPEFIAWRTQARYNDAAQEIAATLREARSQALSRNLQHRVEFDVDNRQYRITAGDRAINSTAFATVVKDWTVLHRDLVLRGAADCSGTADVTLDFNANGTATPSGICVMTAGPPVTGKYRVAVQSATTGRITVNRL